ncbi:MAG: GNAT family N-acetyltransferase [Actinomycetota bacterium]|nr:GNAT family N-acetyltransferase [Actinomycetota bacterium]
MVDIDDMAPDDFEQAYEARRRSFGSGGLSFEAWCAIYEPAVSDRLALVARDGSTVVASARILPLRQWWHGRAVPMGGVGGVVVAPEARGRGVARALMTAVLQRIGERGDPISMLYPATVPLYRSVGWELAGRQRTIEMASSVARTMADDAGHAGRARRCEKGDGPAIIATLGEVHRSARHSGPIEWDAPQWERGVADVDTFTYLTDDGGGFVAYEFENHGHDSVLDVSHLVASSPATTRALWSMVGSGSSTAPTLRATVAPDDPLPWLGREQHVRVRSELWWMLRLVDHTAAIAARGFPASVTAEIPVHVTDDVLPDNSGDRVIRVGEGRGTLERVDDTGREAGRASAMPLRLDANGIAALYAGVPSWTRRLAGLVHDGSPELDDACDAAFATTAFALDYF